MSARPHRHVPGQPRNTKPDVVAHAASGEYSVLAMVAQYPGGPQFVVVRGNDSVALFFDHHDAEDYAQWKNQKL